MRGFLLCQLGYGEASARYARGPRLSFDEAYGIV